MNAPIPGAADGQFCLLALLLHLYPVYLPQSPDPPVAARAEGLLKMGSASKSLSPKAAFKPRRVVSCSVGQMSLQIKCTIKSADVMLSLTPNNQNHQKIPFTNSISKAIKTIDLQMPHMNRSL